MNTLRQRSLTALVVVVVVAILTLIHPYTYYGLVTALQAGCLWEYLLLIRPFQQLLRWQQQATLVICLSSGCGLHIAAWGLSHGPALARMLPWLMVPLFLLAITNWDRKNLYTALRNVLLPFLGLLYIPVTLLACYILTWQPSLPDWFPDRAVYPMSVIVLIWINDTGAYFAGSLWGRRPLAPSISPAKSWEGFFGGLLLTLTASVGLSSFIPSFCLMQSLGLGTVLVLAATAGDLLESKIKRLSGVKDSGTFLPGHGGLLDRFDSWLIAMPVAAAYFCLALPN